MPRYDPERAGAPATSAWDRLQSGLECCGVATVASDDGAASAETVAPAYAVWRNNLRLNSGAADARVPESCCLSAGRGDRVADCTSDPVADPNLIWTADCFDAWSTSLQSHAAALCVACAVFGGALVVAAALAICLYHLADDQDG